MYLIGKLSSSQRVGWLHEAKGKKFDASKKRSDPIVVTWTRNASNAKIYLTDEDAHYICEMIWGDRHPTDIMVNEVKQCELESGELNIS